MKKYFLLLLLVTIIGCTTAQKGAGIGAVTGGALGAVIGHQSGETVEGAAIGTGVGAITGALIGEQLETKFCPVCGKRFTGGVQFCPNDGTALKQIRK